MNVTPEVLVSVAGVVVSVLFSYIPGLRTWFAAQKDEYKRLLMLVVLAAVTVAIYLLGCKDIIQIDIACEKTGLIQIIGYFVTAVTTNQATYLISPIATDVRKVKETAG